MTGPRLKDLGRWFSGGTPPSDRAEYWDGDVPWLSGKDFDKTVLREPTKFTTEEGAALHSRLMSGGQTVLLLVRGMALAHGLPVARLPFDAAISQDVRGLRVRTEFDPDFIYYALLGRRAELDAHVDRAAHGTARLQDTVYAHRIGWMPDIVTQGVTADFLDRECERIASAIDIGWELVSRLSTATGEFVRNATDDLPRQRIRFGWRVTDCKHRTPEYLDDKVGGFPVISTREVHPGRLVIDTNTRCVSESDFHDLREGGRRPEPGDIIYSRNARLGVAALVGQAQQVCMGQDVVLVSRYPRPSELLVHFLNYAVADQVQLAAVGSTFDRINVPVIKDLMVPSVGPAEEQELVSRIDRAMVAINSAQSASSRLNQALTPYRDSLIHEAVTGKLDVAKVSDRQMAERLHAAAEHRLDEVPA